MSCCGDCLLGYCGSFSGGIVWIDAIVLIVLIVIIGEIEYDCC